MLLLIPTTQREKKSTPTTAISYFEICKSKQTNPKCTHRGRRRRRLHAAKHDARSLSVVVWRGSCHYDSSLPSQWRCTSPPPPPPQHHQIFNRSGLTTPAQLSSAISRRHWRDCLIRRRPHLVLLSCSVYL